MPTYQVHRKGKHILSKLDFFSHRNLSISSIGRLECFDSSDHFPLLLEINLKPLKIYKEIIKTTGANWGLTRMIEEGWPLKTDLSNLKFFKKRLIIKMKNLD